MVANILETLNPWSFTNYKKQVLSQLKAEGDALTDLHNELLRHLPELSYHINNLIGEYKQFINTGETTEKGHLLWRHLFFVTKGVSNEVIMKYLANRFPKSNAPATIDSAFGTFTNNDVFNAAKTLDESGVYQFPKPLDRSVVEPLAALMNEKGDRRSVDCRTVYPFSHLVNTPALRQIAADPFIYYTLQEYFKVPPIMGDFYGFKSIPHSNNAEMLSESAQAFHVDMEHPKFIKLFIYLNDVTEKNGPHCYIPKATRNLPPELYEDRRYFDDEMEKYIPRDRWLHQVGPAGTTFLVDTCAPHKGVPLIDGERRLIQCYYSGTLFGTSPNKTTLPRLKPSAFHREATKYSPRFFERIILND
jgi:hypothetical protein